MPRLFLLRAYGDFIIAIRSVLLMEEPGSIQLIASNHLYPLYEAISEIKDTSKLNIKFEDFEIKNSQLNLFTNRHLLNTETIKQIKKIKQYLINNPNIYGSNDYVEQKSRLKILQNLTKGSFISIVNQNQVYSEYSKFFKIEQKDIFENIPSINSTRKKILVLPDARISKRNLPQEIIQSIIEEVNEKNHQIQVAYFKRVSQVNKKGKVIKVQIKTDLKFNQTVYHNFKELIALILDADFIFGADSLPIHICQFLNKPHYILYPENGYKHFFTPYTLKRNYYSEFDEFLASSIPF